MTGKYATERTEKLSGPFYDWHFKPTEKSKSGGCCLFPLNGTGSLNLKVMDSLHAPA